MINAVPRLRMFAGPNGSGKTTVKDGLKRSTDWFGIYINPDQLEREIGECGELRVDPFGLTASTEEVRDYFLESRFLQDHGLAAAAGSIVVRGHTLVFPGLKFSSYHASVLSDFLRRKALSLSKSFSFETVMSSPDKVRLRAEARSFGFRTYLYYVATEDPAINLERVKGRVAGGGHDVPPDKIISRYHRSLALVPEAVRHTDRAFFFDTSGSATEYFATVTGGRIVELNGSDIPNWFQPILSQL